MITQLRLKIHKKQIIQRRKRRRILHYPEEIEKYLSVSYKYNKIK